MTSNSDGGHVCIAYVVTENPQFHQFILLTMILPLPHDSAIRWEEVLGVPKEAAVLDDLRAFVEFAQAGSLQVISEGSGWISSRYSAITSDSGIMSPSISRTGYVRSEISRGILAFPNVLAVRRRCP